MELYWQLSFYKLGLPKILKGNRSINLDTILFETSFKHMVSLFTTTSLL